MDLYRVVEWIFNFFYNRIYHRDSGVATSSSKGSGERQILREERP